MDSGIKIHFRFCAELNKEIKKEAKLPAQVRAALKEEAVWVLVTLIFLAADHLNLSAPLSHASPGWEEYDVLSAVFRFNALVSTVCYLNVILVFVGTAASPTVNDKKNRSNKTTLS